MTDIRRSTHRRWYVKAGPAFQLGTSRVFGLTTRQLAEWDQWLADRRPRTRIHLEGKP